ncbi:MAG: restriction endonuclease subunit S [Candidatus Margulisbacteria bacterium]|jgi:type I restriction enzyme M protein|nr:restriction endonuclease subunit S [Candidatus Margulisiibacteriota bacterium]
MDRRVLLKKLGFLPKENTKGIYRKIYTQKYAIEVDFNNNTIDYGKKIRSDSKTTQNFSQPENFVILECVNRLLEKGYKPQSIILEKTYSAGHGTSGRLDICVNRPDDSEYLLIECKTYGKEFDAAFRRMKEDGGQLFTYFKFSNKAAVILLYASELKDGKIVYRNEIVKIEDDYRTGDVKDFYERWNKLTKDNGVFDEWVKLYNFESKALTPEQLKPIGKEDSSIIFNSFLEILRHNVVSDKPNAFNKIFTLFLCKIYDEKNTKPNKELAFQWFYAPYQYEGINYPPDDHISFQKRLTDLYKKGMKEFLEKEVTDISDTEFENKYGDVSEDIRKKILDDLTEIRLKKNNEFAIKEVFDNDSFEENAKVVKEVVELLQGYKIRYAAKQQYLSDFFELLLGTGLKQESGQFFTPVPVAQFIIKSLPVGNIVQSKLQKMEKDAFLPHIIDYAAGSGHFITESMHELQNSLENIDSNKLFGDAKKFVDKAKTYPYDWAYNYVYGIEKDYRLIKVSKVGCYLHGDGLAQVIHSDGLGNFKNTKEYKGLLTKTDKDFPQENRQFDILVSNPPYSVSTFRNNASKFYGKDDFGLYDSLTDNSSEIECLFIERAKQLLKDGGVAGIILPSSILNNEGIYTQAREIILRYFEIIAITELGGNTFLATGTNTVVLFLRRRNNYDSINLRKSVERFFDDFQDVTRNGIEKPVLQYINHVWKGITLDDYVTLLKKKPNNAVVNHEIYKEYRAKTPAGIEKDFWNMVITIEKEKLFYFILVYPQKVAVVKTGSRDAEKRFLGYAFSHRRGNEGIHPIQRGKTIEECTRLFDDMRFDNPEKASTYIYNAFKNKYPAIGDSLRNNVFYMDLIDMLTFDRVGFDKNISLSIKKKVTIESNWRIVKLSEVTKIDYGTRIVKATGEGTIYPVYGGGGETFKTDTFNRKNTFIISRFGMSPECIRFVPGMFFLNDSGMTIDTLNKEALNLSYLNYYLYLNQEMVYCCGRGVAQKNIDIDAFNSIPIPLPPLEIQQKIVSEIDVLEKKEAEAKEGMVSLRKSIDRVLETKSAEKYKVGDILTLEYGAALPENNRIKGEFPVMGSNGIVGHHNEYSVKSPAIIVGRKGSAGKITYIDKNCFPIDTAFYVKLIKNKYHPKLIYFALQKAGLENLSGGTGVPGLNRNAVYSKTISLPPFSEQQKIVAKIEKIEAQIDKLRQQLASIPKQKEIILKNYL